MTGNFFSVAFSPLLPVWLLGILAVLAISYLAVKLIFRITYHQAALMLLFCAFAQIITIGVIPLL